MNRIIKKVSLLISLVACLNSISPKTYSAEAYLDSVCEDKLLECNTEKETNESEYEFDEFTPDEKLQTSDQLSRSVSAGPQVTTSIIEDGVYAIESFGISSKWMSVENSSPWENSHIQQVYAATNPTADFNRACLFKISRVGITDRYVIRLMSNNRMTLSVTSTGEVVSKAIPADDALVNVNDTFYIELSGTGYYIRRHGSNNVINLVSSNTANLSCVTKSLATDNSKWKLFKYVGIGRSGLLKYRLTSWGSVGIELESVGEATLFSWSTAINANTVFVDSQPEAMCDILWNSSTNVMTLKARKIGQLRINGKITYPDGTVVHSGFYIYMIVPQEGVYHIQNVGTKRYIDVEGPSVSSGANIQQWQYHLGSQEKWRVEHVANSGGYVRLKSVLSNLYMGIDSSNMSAVKQYNTQNDYTLWKINRAASGNLILLCKATETSEAVLSVPLTQNSNGTDLTQAVYTSDDNFRDEWFILKGSVYIEFRYDNGYVAQNKIDNESDIVTQNRISNKIINNFFPKIHDAFAQMCHLNIVLEQSVIPLYTSDADLCANADRSKQCECIDDSECRLTFFMNPNNNNSTYGFEESVHCKSLTRIRNNLIVDIPDNTIRVAYTGHKTCFYDASPSNGHTSVSGLADYTYPIISICVDQNNETFSLMILIHELTHLYENTHHEQIEGMPCVMEEGRYNRNDPNNYSTFWCQNCLNNITEKLDKFN